jgi:predicted RNase H-like nuclease (RuvC/YqgF family)
MDSHQPGYEMPDHNVFERQMEELKSDMREMRNAISQMAAAMSKLAVLEERNVTINAEMSRMTGRIASVETKVVNMELHQAKFDGSVTGATTTARIIWAVAGGAVASIAGPLLKLVVGH